jgi:hypothetical protein
LDELIAIGPLKVKVRMQKSIGGKTVFSLISKQNVASSIANGYCQFEIKSILDHEVIVIS